MIRVESFFVAFAPNDYINAVVLSLVFDSFCAHCCGGLQALFRLFVSSIVVVELLALSFPRHDGVEGGAVCNRSNGIEERKGKRIVSTKTAVSL